LTNLTSSLLICRRSIAEERHAAVQERDAGAPLQDPLQHHGAHVRG